MEKLPANQKIVELTLNLHREERKMKRIIITIGVVVVLVWLIGCPVLTHAETKPDYTGAATEPESAEIFYQHTLPMVVDMIDKKMNSKSILKKLFPT